MNNLFDFVQQSPVDNWQLVRNALSSSASRKKLKEHLEALGSKVEVLESQGASAHELDQGETEEIFVVLKIETEGSPNAFWKIFGEASSYGEESFHGFCEVQMGKVIRHEWKAV